MGYENGTYADTEAMNSSGQTVNSRAAEMKIELDNLVNCFSESKTVWNGPAAEALYQSFDKFKNLFDQYATVFDELGTTIKNNSRDMADAEQELAQKNANTEL